MGYTKEFLIEAFMSRYYLVFTSDEAENNLRKLATHCYDEVGKDKFRVYASLDANAIKQYKNTLDLTG